MPKKVIDEPIWNVYCEDMTGRTIRIFNVFYSHSGKIQWLSGTDRGLHPSGSGFLNDLINL